MQETLRRGDVLVVGAGAVGLATALALLEDGRGVRIIMVTALDEWDDKRHALETGADDYVEKPFDLRRLAATVDRNVAMLTASG